MTNPLRCVVDASVSIKQFIPDPLSAKVKQLFRHLNQPDTEFFGFSRHQGILFRPQEVIVYSFVDSESQAD